ncbi:MAG: hypothetical protein FWF60_05520 [Oscillospiraceae bacterium]|nr:hypothetical protein [Oscillospiraceae bacterium]
MKKHFASKALASVLVLLMAFGVTASAIDGDTPPAPPASIDITVGQIYPMEQLVEELGGSYKTALGNRNVRGFTCSGAIRCSHFDPPVSCGVYGARVGQGSITIDFFEGPSLSYSGFHVTAASNPVVKEAGMATKDSLSLLPLLEEMGYTADDIAQAAHWDVKVEMKLTVLYGGRYSYQTHGNGGAYSQILLNMTDGQIILVNVKIANPKESWSEFWSGFGKKMLVPFAFFMHPMGWLFIPVAPVIILFQWILWLIEPLIPTKYIDVTPALAF